MKQFEVGKTYQTTSICNSDCIITITVKARTAATLTIIDKFGKEKKLRILKKLSEFRDAETVMPWGNYSMAPSISAE